MHAVCRESVFFLRLLPSLLLYCHSSVFSRRMHAEVYVRLEGRHGPTEMYVVVLMVPISNSHLFFFLLLETSLKTLYVYVARL